MAADHDHPRAAERKEVDPAHLVALAVRVGNLAKAVENFAAREAECKEQLDEVLTRIPTLEEMELLREILADKAGREWLRKRLKVYGIGGIGLLATIYATRFYLSAFLQWLATILK